MATPNQIPSRIRFRPQRLVPTVLWFVPMTLLAMTPMLLLGFSAWAQEKTPAPGAPGSIAYRTHCAQCHGKEGDGRGYAFDYTMPRPRDFTSALFKFRHTDSGEYPTRDNLIDIISRGMPGTAMPPWDEVLSAQDIAEVAAYVQQFYVDEDDEKLEVRPIGDPPPTTPEQVARGREWFVKLECTRCHGNAGRGDGASSMTLLDDWNREPIHPRDLTAGWLFRGGHSPQDIYRTVMYGLNGTPMPAHWEEELLAKEETRWELVHYVRSLGPDTPPEVKATLVAKWVEMVLPDDGGHALWEEAREYYVPLAGQVVLEPRWFLPSVRHLWVRALYNAEEIALRLRWTDATSMDNDAYQGALEKASEGAEGESEDGDDGALADEEEDEEEEGEDEGEGEAVAEGEEEEDVDEDEGDEEEAAAPPPPPEDPADELLVQFPVKHAPGDPLPYFLMGRPGKPVRLWVWRNGIEGATVTAAKSSRFGQWTTVNAGNEAITPAAAVIYKDGQYTLTLKRKRIGAGGPDFPADPGLMPISFSVADGFKHEGGHRRGIATWYTLLLERPLSSRVAWVPLLVMAVVAALQWLLLRRVRRSASETDLNGDKA